MTVSRAGFLSGAARLQSLDEAAAIFRVHRAVSEQDMVDDGGHHTVRHLVHIKGSLPPRGGPRRARVLILDMHGDYRRKGGTSRTGRTTSPTQALIDTAK